MTSPLTDKEKLFVEAYCGEANFDPKLARKLAGYSDHTRRDRAVAFLNKPHIAEAVGARMDRRRATAWYAEEDILKMLMSEATREGQGSTQSGRIQAIVYLGKHIGMFSDKKEEKAVDQSTTINVINYDTGNKDVEKLVKGNEQEVLEHKDDNVVEGLVITQYDKEATDGE